jgi:UDP-N-acetylglucosamine acyltransferase
MSSLIHPSAFVDPTARLAEDVRVGAAAFVGPGVRLGRGCVLEHHASVDGHPEKTTEVGERCRLGPFAYVGAGVRMGRENVLHHHATIEGDSAVGSGNEVFPNAVIGGIPQDILYRKGQTTRLEVGDANVFREGVTINSGTFKETGLTKVGSRNLFLAAAHVGHDSIIEDDCILVNGVLLGGHVKVERGATVGGATPLPPFLTVGQYSYVGGFSRVTRDVPPFMSFQGIPGRVVGLNRVGLKRKGFTDAAIAALENAHRVLFHPRRQESMSSVIATLESDGGGSLTPEVRTLLDFLRASAAGKDGRAREVLHQKWHPKDRE